MLYKIGLATADITPPIGCYLRGLAARTDPSDGIYHPLRAVAVAIDDGARPFLLVSAEWLGFYELTTRTREEVSRATGLPEERIILLATHTHCAPVGPPGDPPPEPGYVAHAIAAIAGAAARAWETRAPAALAFGQATCTFAGCRRRPGPDGQALYKLHRPGPHDHRVPFLLVTSPAGQLRGLLFDYACHTTCRFGTQIGGDFAAFACDRLEAAAPGLTACFLPGCGGDQKPGPPEANGEDFRVHELHEVRQRGDELADAVLAAVRAGGLSPIAGPIHFQRRFIELRMESADPAVVRQHLTSPTPAFRAWAEQYHALLTAGQPTAATARFEIQTACFGGDLAAVVLGAEMDVEHGLRLQRDLAGRFKHVLPIAYANDLIGYIPVRRQIPEGGYEVLDAQYYWRRPGPFVGGTEDLIHAAVREMLPAF